VAEDTYGEKWRALVVGRNVLCMTATHYWIGRVVGFDSLSIGLADSSWVPSVGRHHEALAKGTLDEVEPNGAEPIEIPRLGTVVLPWSHKLPTKAK
jgi:hypothetical protein